MWSLRVNPLPPNGMVLTGFSILGVLKIFLYAVYVSRVEHFIFLLLKREGALILMVNKKENVGIEINPELLVLKSLLKKIVLE